MPGFLDVRRPGRPKSIVQAHPVSSWARSAYSWAPSYFVGAPSFLHGRAQLQLPSWARPASFTDARNFMDALNFFIAHHLDRPTSWTLNFLAASSLTVVTSSILTAVLTFLTMFNLLKLPWTTLEKCPILLRKHCSVFWKCIVFKIAQPPGSPQPLPI